MPPLFKSQEPSVHDAQGTRQLLARDQKMRHFSSFRHKQLSVILLSGCEEFFRFQREGMRKFLRNFNFGWIFGGQRGKFRIEFLARANVHAFIATQFRDQGWWRNFLT